ncbi:MAG: hypothetical protein KC636_03165 [Myxococcales bacterium]|nr:hypothetical protein [Myxococcales bacterium]
MSLKMPGSSIPSALARALPRAAICAGLIVAAAPAIARAEPPGLDTTRHLSMGRSSRASSWGGGAVMINPASMGLSPTFSIEPAYQVKVENQTHSAGLAIMDSLNNERLAIGLSYAFLYGSPKVTFRSSEGLEKDVDLRHLGHEVGLAVAVNVLPGWLSIAVKPKYQYTQLSFEVAGERFDANKLHNSFGLDLSLQLVIRQWVSVAIMGNNLAGAHQPAYTDLRALTLDPHDVNYETLDPTNVRRISDYPRTLAHAIAVFPTRNPGFSINFDGTYDFTSYWREEDDQPKVVRMTMGGGAEYTVGPVPIRAGGYWDSRGSDPDRGYISGGLGFLKRAEPGGVGVDIGVGFLRQIAGPYPETFIGAHVAILLWPQVGK